MFQTLFSIKGLIILSQGCIIQLSSISLCQKIPEGIRKGLENCFFRWNEQKSHFGWSTENLSE